MSISEKFAKYVSQNILGMVGISFYILADTYFISKAVGADGITALNLVLPVYSIIFAIGNMIGVGSAIKFSILKGKNREQGQKYFFNGLFFGTAIGLLFSLAGLFFSENIISFLGGDAGIVQVGKTYTKIFMIFAPCFIWNHICNAFVRNDGNPTVAMAATLISSIFNVVFDYILMFPCGMAMEGAALATSLSPVVGILVCLVHFMSKKSTVRLKIAVPSLKKLVYSMRAGISAFVGEISSGVTTVVFNYIILNLAGNTGVAAYGVVANISLVAMAVLNGVALGAQPLISENYGKDRKAEVLKIRKMAFFTVAAISVIIIAIINIWTKDIANIFNGEGNKELERYAIQGLRLYFTGCMFAGINMVSASFFSAIDSARWAFMISVSRGVVSIIISAFLMSAIFRMNGVWLAFSVAEAVTMIITVTGNIKIGKQLAEL